MIQWYHRKGIMIMTSKNKEKAERKTRRQTFVGIRPSRFKPKKGQYDRKANKAETKEMVKEG